MRAEYFTPLRFSSYDVSRYFTYRSTNKIPNLATPPTTADPQEIILEQLKENYTRKARQKVHFRGIFVMLMFVMQGPFFTTRL